MKKNKKAEKFRSMIRRLILEALANKFGQGGNIEAAEQVANAHWGNVYLVMPKGEGNNNVFYRVTLHNSSGPVKYLKQDPQGKWFFMDPPQQVWRPMNPSQVPSTEMKECNCAPGCTCDKDDMKGDTTDVNTMATANVAVAEAIDYRQSNDELIKAFSTWKSLTPADTKSHNAVAFTAGWNAAVAKNAQSGLNEMTTSSAAGGQEGGTIKTPFAFSRRDASKNKATKATIGKGVGYKLAKKEF